MTVNINEILGRLPDDASGALVVLSGGLDSTTALRLAVEKYGAAKVSAVSFFYGQKQVYELELAAASCERLGVKHTEIDASFLYDINIGFSANVDADISMPTLEDVLGDPKPPTYVANRNMIMFSIAAAVAETQRRDLILCGLQSNDTYGYHDTTPVWVEKMNSVLSENRDIKIKIIAPFNDLNKREEIEAVQHLDGNLDLFSTTLTCYNPKGPALDDPDRSWYSCGVCPSCRERLAAFAKLGLKDPVRYLE